MPDIDMVDKVWGAWSKRTQPGDMADTRQTQGGHMADTWRASSADAARAFFPIRENPTSKPRENLTVKCLGTNTFGPRLYNVSK